MGLPDTLIDRFFHHATDEATRRPPAQLEAIATSMAELAADRVPGHAAVRVINPSTEEQGWSSRHTAVQVVTDDMPFLVDSVLGEVARHGLQVHQLLHPQLVVDEDGAVLPVEPRDAGPGQRTESWILVETERVRRPEDLEALARGVEGVLVDVRRAIEDWPSMRQQARGIIAELELAPPSTVDPTTVQPVVDFIRWLDDHHFTYLGYRSYDLVEEEDAAYLRSVPGSGLGILRDERGAPATLSPLRPEAAATAQRLGVTLVRVPTVGTDAEFVSGLVDLVEERAAEARGETPVRPTWPVGLALPSVCAPGCCPNLRDARPAVCGRD